MGYYTYQPQEFHYLNHSGMLLSLEKDTGNTDFHYGYKPLTVT